ncbi:MAG TPA: DUF4179 domain-containing protein [Ktedonosporobacter sp.]|nr:DUF4179 domain-containing protein [Ktedonosporobacter sp.]
MIHPIIPRPCPQWEEVLATGQTETLSLAEHEALVQHLQSCQACSAALSAYQAMDRAILRLPAAIPLATLPQHILRKRRAVPVAGSEQAPPLSAGAAFSSERNRPGRAGRSLRLLQTLAAVLVVGALVGSALALFAFRHLATTPVGNQASPPAQKKNPCLFLQLQATENGDGFRNVCAHHLYQDLHLTGTLAGYPVTLEQAYADGNEILLAFTMPAALFQAHSLSSLWPTLTVAGQSLGPGTRLIPRGETDVYLEEMPFEGRAGIDQVLGSRQILEIDTQLQITDHRTGSAASHPFHVHFSIPFQAGKHVMIQQTRLVGGMKVTLKDMIITPSMVRMNIHMPTDPGLGDLEILLTVAGIAHPISLENGGGQWPDRSFLSGANVFDRSGTWTITIQSQTDTQGQPIPKSEVTVQVP